MPQVALTILKYLFLALIFLFLVALLVGGEKPRIFDLRDELILGRSGKCHIVLGDTYASQVHARVFSRNGQFFLEDMGSTNGTYLNSRKVTTATPVNRGDRARIGRTELEFRR